MITSRGYLDNNALHNIKVYYGLSTDTKPNNAIGNGSVFVEMDTSKIYFFDGENATWLEWGA